MKPVYVLIAALAIAAAGCGDDDSPTAPGNDNLAQFTSQLLPSNEVPPVANAESTGQGTVVIDLNLTKDSAGAITAATADFRVQFTGFPSTTVINIAHIHPGAAGVNGPVRVNTTLAPGEVTVTNGAGSFVKTNIPVTAADAQAIINNPAGFYFNVHTAANPGGVMRGQLVRSN
jgi:hypothetical protein